MVKFVLQFLIFCMVVTAVRGFISFYPRQLVRPLNGLQLSMYSVRLISKKKNSDVVLEVPGGANILDHAEMQGVSIPYSCRAGSCSSCVGVVRSGSVEQASQIFLTDEQVDNGYVLTCCATAVSDCEIEVDVEDSFYNSEIL